MIRLLALLVFTTSVNAAEPSLKLFDQETTFGWKTEGKVEVKAKAIHLGGDGKAASASLPAMFPSMGTWDIQCSSGLEIDFTNQDSKVVITGFSITSDSTLSIRVTVEKDFSLLHLDQSYQDGLRESKGILPKHPRALGLIFRTQTSASISVITYTPPEGTSLFNGKDLTGWQTYKGDAKKEASAWTVTPAGELSVVNGPGDLQTTKDYGDVLVRLDVKTQGKALNSGLFFRCLPNEYQQGYEMQIQNAYLNDDRTKPADFGTGAIYRRVPARKVVSNDNEWFTMHLIAVGPNIRTWVNGEPVVAWVDDRKADDNPRKGLRTAAGRLSLQGHDPTTNILFKNITVVDLSK